MYNNSLLALHLGVVKTYLRIKEKFYLPNLMYHLHGSVHACQTCQVYVLTTPKRHFQPKINLKHKSMYHLSCDIQFLHYASVAHMFILGIADVVKNYVIAFFLHSGK